ncbi:hydroxyacylglutathione hydrolase [Clostridium acetireducens DSM 10703]|jgi:hydroxyacylglutathione hydrolase|uniref:Hydroxyacylglutathione hydrolase n=1 Tax=Clostridium acetireducens DSM 10703 TaxID=1121290 RepID=A0A1E8EZW1_9CLOT|nr:MBL fold metallo-hydrolase [Clostridium acetireducens]OFI06675.1 hydroxyacylglutathione hydrolase [Clostridium acetireducens DSM 10703]
MEIIKVKGNTFCIDTGMSYIPFYKVNDEEIIMLDSGLAKEREGIDKLLEKNNFKVIAIICTHVHVDHTGNVSYLKDKYNSLVAMTGYDAFLSSSAITLKTHYINQTLSEVKTDFGHMICKADIIIGDNQDSVSINDIKFKIIHTPGHSAKHICIITPDNVVYLADALVSSEIMEGAKLPYSFALTEDLKSKQKLLKLKCSKYIVSHKDVYTSIRKLINENIKFYKSIASNVYNIINASMTLEEIIKTIIEDWNISVKNSGKYLVIEESLMPYIEYLKEIGMIKLIMEDGVLKYTRNCVEISKAL